jgi:hypothetical protein
MASASSALSTLLNETIRFVQRAVEHDHLDPFGRSDRAGHLIRLYPPATAASPWQTLQ